MTLKIKIADKTDIKNLVEFAFKEPPVLTQKLFDDFDDVLTQTGYHLLLAEIDGKLSGTLAVSIINGIGDKYPLAVLSGGKLSETAKESGAGDALVKGAEEIARKFGCKALIS